MIHLMEGIEHACNACQAIPKLMDTCVHLGPRSCGAVQQVCEAPQRISASSSSLCVLLLAWQGRQAAGFTTGVVKCTPGNLAGETCSRCTSGVQIPLYPDVQLPPHREQAASGVLQEGVGLTADVGGLVSDTDSHDGSSAVR